MNKTLKYIKVNNDNLLYATKVQKEIFPEESGYLEFIDCIENSNIYNNYYLVYDNDEIIGITGLYNQVYSEDTIWMGWYGVLAQKRNKGYGTKIFLDTIEMAKEYNFKYFRVFTSTIENPDVVNLYLKNTDYNEIYNNEKDYNFNNSCVIYTKKLIDCSDKLWNNEYLNINEMISREQKSNQIVKDMNL